MLLLLLAVVNASDAELWNRTLPVPYESQPNDHTCGPTSLSMLMSFYKVHATVAELCNYMSGVPGCPEDGVGEGSITSAAAHWGFKNAYWGTDDEHFTQVKSLIGRGVPVITHMLVGPSGPYYCDTTNPAYIGTYGHYIVTNGLVQCGDGSELACCVVSNDPARYQNTHYDILSFRTAWTSPYGPRRYFVLV